MASFSHAGLRPEELSKPITPVLPLPFDDQVRQECEVLLGPEPNSLPRGRREDRLTQAPQVSLRRHAELFERGEMT
jgi:hypothetical protein